MFEAREKLEARVRRLESELEDAEMELEDAECEVRTLREQVKMLDAYKDALSSISAQIARVEDAKLGFIQADLDIEWDRLRELIAEALNV